MKKNQLFALALGAVMSLSLAACGTSGSAGDKTDNTAQDTAAAAPVKEENLGGESVQIPNPWTDAASLEEAEQLAGFSIVVPDAIGSYTDRSFRVLTGDNGATLEVDYTGDEEKQAYIRKAPGADDISGDYNTYSQTETMTAEDGREVTMQGTEDGFHLAAWTADGYTYCIGVSDGLSSAELFALAADVQ